MMTQVALLALIVTAPDATPGSASAPGAQAPAAVEADAGPPTTHEMVQAWLALRDTVATDELSCGSWAPTNPVPFTFGKYLADILTTVAEEDENARVTIVAEATWQPAARLKSFWRGPYVAPPAGAWQCSVYFHLAADPDPWHAGIRFYLTSEAHERVGPVECLF